MGIMIDLVVYKTYTDSSQIPWGLHGPQPRNRSAYCVLNKLLENFVKIEICFFTQGNSPLLVFEFLYTSALLILTNFHHTCHNTGLVHVYSKMTVPKLLPIEFEVQGNRN